MISFSECVVDIYMIKGRQQISNEYDLDFNITKGQIYKQYGAVVAGYKILTEDMLRTYSYCIVSGGRMRLKF